ncbi:MAG: type II secretion system minor pseudopilin GspJ [Proteobacteria bacterium]|nr:type II secretion system minor pseudopilin GspJ [Pseudomonadota bacterium]
MRHSRLAQASERNQDHHPGSGFTLLEVLVAISIFAIIGLSAHQMLGSVIATQVKVRTTNEAFTEVVRALGVIERDVSQLVYRSIRDEYGEPRPPMIIGGDEQIAMEFTRTGWNNPLGLPRSDLQRVLYRLNDDTLERVFWLVLDRAEDSEPVVQRLAHDVRDFRVQLIDPEDERVDLWPGFEDTSQFAPAGVEILLETGSMGTFTRIYSLVEATDGAGDVSGGEGPDENEADDEDSDSDDDPGEDDALDLASDSE